MECPQCHQSNAEGVPYCTGCGAILPLHPPQPAPPPSSPGERPPLLPCLLASLWQSKTGLGLLVAGEALVVLGTVYPPLGNILLMLLSVFSRRRSATYSPDSLEDAGPLYFVGGGMMLMGLLGVIFTFVNNYYHPEALAPAEPAPPQPITANGVAAGAVMLAIIVLLAGGGVWHVGRSMQAATQTQAAVGTAFVIRFTTATPAPPTRTPLPSDTPLPGAPTLAPGATRVYADGMVGLYAPAGEFLMGSTDADKDAESNEKPQHTVYLDSFWIDRTEVTNAMFARFVDAANYVTDAEKAGNGMAFDPSTAKLTETASADWRHPEGPSTDISQSGDHPVVQVSWNDAQAYCEWAGRVLPSEARWEKAARGTDGRRYPWGDGAPDFKLLNFDVTLIQQPDMSTKVGAYPLGASPYGALDMAGNVWEWVSDWYDKNYYADAPARNPTGPATGLFRTIRGGGWASAAPSVRAALRFYSFPDSPSELVGFRCAR